MSVMDKGVQWLSRPCRWCFKKDFETGRSRAKRKFLVYVFSAIVATFVTLPISWSFPSLSFMFFEDYFDSIIFFFIFIQPFLILYALPVTLLSDCVTRNSVGKKRIFHAFLVHVSFGISFPLLFNLLMEGRIAQYFTEDRFLFIGATLTAITFWIIDEIIREMDRRKFQ